jgi:hypothetical protein
MKYVIFFVSIILPLVTTAQNCNPSKSTSGLQSLTDIALNSSVTLVNQDIKQTIANDFSQFRLTTEMLATKNPTKEALADWYFNMVNLNKLAFDKIRSYGIIKDESEAQRLSLVIVNGIVSTWLEQAFDTSMHEMSHAEAAKAAGADQIWFATMKHPDQQLTIGGLFQNLMFKGGGAYTYYQGNNGFTPNQMASISGAGLNHQTKFAELLAKDSSVKGQFHQTELIPYLINKFSVPLYYSIDRSSESSDVKTYVESLAAQGKIKPDEINETMSKMAKFATISGLLSGRTWEGLQATMGYVKTGNATADTLKIKTPVGDVTWPEVSTYLNIDNISMKANTNLKTSTTANYDIAIEKSVVGSNISEVSASANFIQGRTSTSVTAIVNDQQKYGAKAHLAYDVEGNGTWIVFIEGAYDTGTLDGQRTTYQTNDIPQTRIYSGIEYRLK